MYTTVWCYTTTVHCATFGEWQCMQMTHPIPQTQSISLWVTFSFSLGLYKKAVIDADFVIQKLDEKNLRSWLCRAQAYYLQEEFRDFEKSVNEAKKNNPKDGVFIEEIIQLITKALL